MALPKIVWLKKYQRTATRHPVPNITHILCGRMVAPPTMMGLSPVNDGRAWNCLSSTICATPRRKIEAPMVMMMMVTTEESRAGSMASFSKSRPIPMVMSTAMNAAMA